MGPAAGVGRLTVQVPMTAKREPRVSVSVLEGAELLNCFVP